MTISWRIWVKWDGTNWTDEASNCRNLVISRGRDNLIDGQAFGKIKVGEATIILDNADGRYDPYNTSSPLYGLVYPGKEFAVDDSNTRQFTGTVDSIKVFGINKTVEIHAVDTWKRLSEAKVTVKYDNYPHVDGAIKDVYNKAVGDAKIAGDFSIDAIKNWYAVDKNAKEVIEELAALFMDEVFVDKNGYFVYLQHNDVKSIAKTVNQSSLLKDMAIKMPWECQRNKVTYITKGTYIVNRVILVYELEDPIFLKSGDNTELEFEYKNIKSDSYLTDVVYYSTLNTALDGSGDTPTINNLDWWTTGKSLIWSGTPDRDCYIISFVIYGKEVRKGSQWTVSYQSSSYTTYPNPITFESEYIEDVNLMKTYALFLRDWFGNINYLPTIIVEGRPDWQFSLDLYDRITVNIPKFSLSSDYFIGGIDYEWLTDNGQLVRTTYKLEPVKVTVPNYWVLETGALDSTAKLGV